MPGDFNVQAACGLPRVRFCLWKPFALGCKWSQHFILRQFKRTGAQGQGKTSLDQLDRFPCFLRPLLPIAFPTRPSLIKWSPSGTVNWVVCPDIYLLFCVLHNGQSIDLPAWLSTTQEKLYHLDKELWHCFCNWHKSLFPVPCTVSPLPPAKIGIATFITLNYYGNISIIQVLWVLRKSIVSQCSVKSVIAWTKLQCRTQQKPLRHTKTSKPVLNSPAHPLSLSKPAASAAQNVLGGINLWEQGWLWVIPGVCGERSQENRVPRTVTDSTRFRPHTTSVGSHRAGRCWYFLPCSV